MVGLIVTLLLIVAVILFLLAAFLPIKSWFLAVGLACVAAARRGRQLFDLPSAQGQAEAETREVGVAERPPGRCECGAPPKAVVHVVQRTGALRLTHYRCSTCSREWTVDEPAPDVSEPVSADEVIDAHAALNDPTLTVEDLVRRKA